MSDKVIALIPARGGSKGIPKKNIKEFCGKPLVAWSILQAVNTSQVDAVYVSSDSDEILDIAKEFGAKPIKRPDNISGDTSSTESAIEHMYNEVGSSQKMGILLQPTSPLRKPDDIGNAITEFQKNGWDSCFSGEILEDFLVWKKLEDGGYDSINYNWQKRGRRQDRVPEYSEDGSIYLFKPNVFLDKGNRLGGNIGFFPMEFWQLFEIDSHEDWELCEVLFKHYLEKTYAQQYASI